jgi:transposase
MKKESQKPGKASSATGRGDPGRKRLNPEHEPNAAGIDVGAEFISVAVPEGRGEKPWVRNFKTYTGELHKAADWLLSCGITTLVMESTGSYWMPVYDLLERRGLESHLVRANALKHVPGRKSDCSDARWLQLLHASGLLRGAFRPPESLRGVRELIRHRIRLVQEATRHLQRQDKLLVQMNVRLKMVISSLHTDTAQRILDAIDAGERDGVKLARLRDPRCKHSHAEIVAAMTGHWQESTCFLLHLEHEMWRQTQLQIAKIDAELQRLLEQLPCPAAAATEPLSGEATAGEVPAAKVVMDESPEQTLLEVVREQARRSFGCDPSTLPGFSVEQTLKLMGELGSGEVMLKSFDDGHFFAAWTGLPPRPSVSGGKILASKLSGKMTTVGTIFEQAAYTLGRGDSLIDDELRRQKARKGKAQGIRIIAHKLARIFYAMVKNRCDYDETLAFADRERREAMHRRNLERRAHKLGLKLVDEKA